MSKDHRTYCVVKKAFLDAITEEQKEMAVGMAIETSRETCRTSLSGDVIIKWPDDVDRAALFGVPSHLYQLFTHAEMLQYIEDNNSDWNPPAE